MAGDWIKMRSNLWDDPRVGSLADITETSEATVIGALYWLWAMADQHTEDGILPGLTLRQIDRKTGVPGFGQALCDVGWLADQPEGVRITRFEEHNGASAKKRSVTAQRVAKHRSANADVTQAALQKEHASVTPALAREEKRREEEIPSAPNGAGGKPPPKSPAEQEKADLWASLKTSLVEQQTTASMKAAGELLGKAAKQYGEAVFIEAARATVRAQPPPGDTYTYFVGLCETAAGKRQKLGRPAAHTGFDQKDYRDGVAEDGTFH